MSRIAALFLVLGISLPASPTFALRIQAGLESATKVELTRTLSAGLEETPQRPTRSEIALNQEAGRLKRLGLFRKALDKLEEALRINPRNPVTLNAKSSLLVLEHRYTEALEVTDQALKLDRHGVQTYTVRAQALNGMGRYAEALEVTDQALKLKPDNVQTYIVRAQALNGMGRYAEGLAVTDQALKLDRHGVQTYTVRAQALNGMGRYAEADASMRQAREIDLEDDRTCFQWGLLFLDREDWRHARDSFENAFRLNPANRRAEDYAQKDWAVAADFEMKKALALDRDRMSVLLDLPLISSAEELPASAIGPRPEAIARYQGRWIPLPGNPLPSSSDVFEGEAIYLGSSESDRLRPGKLKDAGVLLIDFHEYLHGKQRDRARVEKFLPSNVGSLQFIVFYNAPGDLQAAIDQLRPKSKLFQGRPVVAVAGPLQAPDEPLLKIRLEMQDRSVSFTLDRIAAGLEERVSGDEFMARFGQRPEVRQLVEQGFVSIGAVIGLERFTLYADEGLAAVAARKKEESPADGLIQKISVEGDLRKRERTARNFQAPGLVAADPMEDSILGRFVWPEQTQAPLRIVSVSVPQMQRLSPLAWIALSINRNLTVDQVLEMEFRLLTITDEQGRTIHALFA